jgi:hypothetical protein
MSRFKGQRLGYGVPDPAFDILAINVWQLENSFRLGSTRFA